MNFEDRIFGNVKIEDSLILDLIHAPSFQRLKRINQYGGVNLIYPTYQVSRFEHSIGVWWILKSLNTSMEIQVAGLLHDIGHTAFSHMVDRAMKNKEENFHTNYKQNMDLNNDILKIFKKYGIEIINPDLYPEIKGLSSEIGADKIDYAIRDYYGAIGKKTLFGLEVLNNIKIQDRVIIFTNEPMARKYAIKGLKAMWKVIYDPKVAVVYQSLTEIIRVGLKDGWLSEKDLKKDDKYVLNVIKENKLKFPVINFRIFEKSFIAREVKKSEKYDFYDIKLRARYFDPLVDCGGKIINLSKFDNIYLRELNRYRKVFEKRKNGVFIRVDFKLIR